MRSHAVVLRSYVRMILQQVIWKSPKPLVSIVDSVEVFAGHQEGFYDPIMSGFRALPQTLKIHHCKNKMYATCIHFRRSDRVRNERMRSGKNLEKIFETDDKAE